MKTWRMMTAIILALALAGTALATEPFAGKYARHAQPRPMMPAVQCIIEDEGSDHGWLDKNGKATYQVTFKDDEQAIVTVMGDGDTDMDLYILDANGLVIVKDSGAECTYTWLSRWTMTCTIVIRGRAGQPYDLHTNGRLVQKGGRHDPF